MDSKKFSASLPINSVKVTDSFWDSFVEKVRNYVIPYQWEALNDRIEGAEKSYCIHNFKAAAGMEEGGFQGCVFQDSDVAKWIEAVGYALMTKRDQELEKTADGAIDIICAAQQPDGYMDTYYILNGLDKRWTNLKDNHELYCLGHMIEGAVAYYQATGKDKLLNAVIKCVEHVNSVFGPEEGKKKGYPGHEVIEMALVKLFHVTGDEKHLKLAKYFIDQRGQEPLYFEKECVENGNAFWWKDGYLQYQYYQAGLPVREQKSAEGHSVRAVYLFSGMADVARETGDESLEDACLRLWRNMVSRRMYVTGAIGSSEYGEAFTFDYDLPNDTVYGETCAAIGLVFFAKRMLEISPKTEYADVMERALYNGVISGMSYDGKSFFYVNPLEVLPEASEKDHNKKHVKVQRQKWFGCACCPPNLARLISSISSYAVTANEKSLYMHLYMGGEYPASFGGKDIKLSVSTKYPWDGEIGLSLGMEDVTPFELAMRIPGWCGEYSLLINGKEESLVVKDGYACIERTWSDGDEVSLRLSMPVRIERANPRVREDIGKVAVARGPVVYCLEEEDNGSGLHRVFLNQEPDFRCEYDGDFFGGAVLISTKGKYMSEDGWDEETLYSGTAQPSFEDKKLKFIPYYLWANRSPGEMTVWVRE